MRQATRGSWTMAFSTMAVALALLVVPAGVFAQGIPTEFTNLKILPQDITRDELVPIMRGMASALGGRCSFCHMVSDRLDQPTDDFASDEKGRKRRARVMIRMVEEINGTHLASLPERREPNVEVTCNTCHGGVSRPQPLEDLIWNVLEEEGIDAAVERYGELRERYLGSRAYDFSFRPLNVLGERLGRARAAEGVRFLEINVEYNPTALTSHIMLGQLHEANGDNESALAVYRGVLEMDPNTQFFGFYSGQARQRIEAITGGG